METTYLLLIAIVAMLFFSFVMVSAAIRICPETARGAVFRLGRYVGLYGPGIYLVLPIIDRVVMIDVREQTHTLTAQSAISADNVRLTVDLSWRYRIIDPAKSILNVSNLDDALQKILLQVWLDTVETQPYADVIHHRPQVREEMLRQLQTASANWGVEITGVQLGEIKQG